MLSYEPNLLRILSCHNDVKLTHESLYTLDIDECEANPGICGANSVCTNTDGSYLCQCDPGYSGNADGTNCQGNVSVVLKVNPDLSRFYNACI